VSDEIQRVESDLKNKAKGMNQDQKIQFLIKEYSILSFNSWYNITYMLIYGSQLKFLNRLNESKQSGVKVSEAKKYFVEVKETFPELNSTSDEYFDFLWAGCKPSPLGGISF
jgi:hypothetical protein